MYPILSSLMIDSGFALNSMVKEECAAAAVGAEMQHQQQQLLTECKIEQSALENDFDQDDGAELATVENALSDLDETFLASVVGQHGSFEFVEATDAADAYRSESIDYMMNMEDQFDATQPSLENSSELTFNLLDEALCMDLLASLDQQCWHTSSNNNNETDQAILAVLIAEVEANINGDDESIQAEVSADLAPLLHDMSESALSSPSDAACQSPMYESRRNSDSDNSISTTTMKTIASGRSAKKRKAAQDDDDNDGDGDELSDARSSNNKKEANKAAALRYRNKKQREKDEMFAECEDYERRNASLKQQIDDVQSEIDCIKSLLVQVLVSKNKNNSNTSLL